MVLILEDEQMKKLKEGDRVLINMPLQASAMPSAAARRKYNNKVATITEKIDSTFFKINIDGGRWLWSKEYLAVAIR